MPWYNRYHSPYNYGYNLSMYSYSGGKGFPYQLAGGIVFIAGVIVSAIMVALSAPLIAVVAIFCTTLLVGSILIAVGSLKTHKQVSEMNDEYIKKIKSKNALQEKQQEVAEEEKKNYKKSKKILK